MLFRSPEVLPTELEDFVCYLENQKYQIDEIGILETTVECEENSKQFLSLNEIVVRDKKLNSVTLDIEIEHELLERFNKISKKSPIFYKWSDELPKKNENTLYNVVQCDTLVSVDKKIKVGR